MPRRLCFATSTCLLKDNGQTLCSGAFRLMSRFSLASSFSDLLWPRTCLACGRSAVDPVMCPSCRQRSKRASTSVEYTADGRIRSAFALWKFERDAPVRVVLHRLKYGNCPWIGLELGEDLARSGSVLLEKPWDVIIPVPLHKLRLLERGYNQSDWIARGIGRAMNVPVASREMARRRNTKSQTDLAREDRRTNVESAFSLRGVCSLEGCRVILVDDTLTTGATLGAAARILVDAGVTLVQPAAVARATLWLDEEQPDARSVITSQTKSVSHGASIVGYNL